MAAAPGARTVPPEPRPSRGRRFGVSSALWLGDRDSKPHAEPQCRRGRLLAPACVAGCTGSRRHTGTICGCSDPAYPGLAGVSAGIIGYPHIQTTPLSGGLPYPARRLPPAPLPPSASSAALRTSARFALQMQTPSRPPDEAPQTVASRLCGSAREKKHLPDGTGPPIHETDARRARQTLLASPRSYVCTCHPAGYYEPNGTPGSSYSRSGS